MRRNCRRLWWGLLLIGALSPGCNWASDDATESVDDDQSALAEAVVGPSATGTPNRPNAPFPGLETNLKLGDRFAIVKTIEQTVTQTDPASPPDAIGQSRLELTMSLSVAEVRDDGRKRLALAFERVRYRHNLSGNQLQFDSTQPAGALPVELQAYQGLVGNGFYFWLSTDHRIDQVVGFDDFLKRCVRATRIPFHQSAVAALWDSSGPDAVSQFFDDTIGVFPTALGNSKTSTSPLAVGQEWTRQREIGRPFPMFVRSRYTLKALDAKHARIAFMGSIAQPPGVIPLVDRRGQIQLQMRGGNTIGNCIIDTGTGLPVESSIERHIDMIVRLADGSRFEQQKHVVTTLQVSATAAAAIAEPGRAHPVRAGDPPETSNRVIEAGHSRQAR